MEFPPRYEPKRLLGQGGGGEVWAVRDRVTGELVALKLLASDAGPAEMMALVREATALSGLEGLGVPRVVAFGSLPDTQRRYLVRELVVGDSLEQILDGRAPAGDGEHDDGQDDHAGAAGDQRNGAGTPWLEPLAAASDQLTVLHRAGILHGDIKPANVIVGAGGAATLVDLGLAAPWREAGSAPQGLTPKYAAPELFAGEPLTVRAEVYAVGATLGDALRRRGHELAKETREDLEEVARRATADDPSARYPSVDELASALRHAAKIGPAEIVKDAALPVLGLEPVAQRLREALAGLGPGDAIAVEGPSGSGRTTLARRLAWTLGAEGRAVAAIEAPPEGHAGLGARELVELELRSSSDHGTGAAGAAGSGAARTAGAAGMVIVLDDADRLDDETKRAVARAAADGAVIVAVGSRSVVREIAPARVVVFEVPPLDAAASEELVRRAIPSLSPALSSHLVSAVNGRPGKLRAVLRDLAGRAIVGADDIDAALIEARTSVAPPSSMTRAEALDAAEKALAMGRIDDADRQLAHLGPARDADERVQVAVARARVALGRWDAKEAMIALEEVARDARLGPLERGWKTTLARAHLRSGDYAEASRIAAEVLDVAKDDAIASDALSVLGIALAWTGDAEKAMSTLAEAQTVARAIGLRRAEAVALGAMAIVHQRAGRTGEARAAYEASLAAAEDARDASTVALTRLNLAGLARAEGDLAVALAHLEAAVDMGRRAGSLIALQGALLHLANLDLYLGRYARARSSIESLAATRAALSPISQASLFGLEAELAARTLDIGLGSDLYERSAAAWESQGRPLDAAESRLEAILTRAREPGASATRLSRELAAVRARAEREPGGDLGEHEALARIVEGSIALVGGDEQVARVALDRACEQAEKTGRREWAWVALEARARLASSQGHSALARRDVDAALAILEQTAAKLPRDLREVFWNDPRRRALREAHTATQSVPAFAAPAGLASSGRTANVTRGSGTTLLGAPLPAEDRLARIFEITRDLATEHDIARLLTKVTDHAIALLAAERGFVVLVNARGELEAHAARDRKGELDLHAEFSRSVAEKVVLTGEPVIATSARDDARLREAVSVHQLMIQSIACVPIRSARPGTPDAPGPTIGALYLETRLRPGVRFEGELPTLAAFADQAAIAIENARLVTENRARAEQLAVTNSELEYAKARLSELLGRRTEQLAATRRDLKQVRAELRSHFGYAGLVGTSQAMRRLYAMIDRLKETDVPVLVTGESGTGKEVVSKALHGASARAKKPFLGINCGAIPQNLLESELFGHVKGAFTGAERDRKGLFREAEGGTILLDEIGELPLKMQAGLLRVLQEAAVRPVGGAKEEKVDVRVIAATNRDLEQMVAEGTFREDLFYRLHVIVVNIPALRERSDDIPALVDHFIGIFAARYRRERKSVERDALRRLSSYEWPGNVRQLENVLLNAWLMSEDKELTLDDFELPLAAPRVTAQPAAARERVPAILPQAARTKAEFKDSERERILAALAASNWNRVQAARMIGVPRRTFYRRLKEFGIL